MSNEALPIVNDQNGDVMDDGSDDDCNSSFSIIEENEERDAFDLDLEQSEVVTYKDGSATVSECVLSSDSHELNEMSAEILPRYPEPLVLSQFLCKLPTTI